MFTLTEQWRKHMIPEGQTVPTARCYACAVVLQSNVYMFGGYMGVTSSKRTNELWKLAMDHAGLFAWSEIVMTNNEKTPSPRSDHTGWEYAGKLWSFGGYGSSSDGFLNEYGDFVKLYNNQLLCFNPSNEEWTNPQCFGMVPEPRGWHATTKCKEKVWLYGGYAFMNALHDLPEHLHELNMHSCTWTQIEIRELQQQPYIFCTLNTISDNKLVLHGGKRQGKGLSDTWILDIETKTWKRYTSDTNAPQYRHTGSQGISNSVVIIGGVLANDNMEPHQSVYKPIFHVLTEPKSLQQLAMQKIYKHHTVLPWKCLPRKLTVLLDIQETQDADEVSDIKTE